MAAVALFMVGRLAKFNDIFTSTVPTINNFSNHALRINCLTLFVQLKIQNNILFLYTTQSGSVDVKDAQIDAKDEYEPGNRIKGVNQEVFFFHEFYLGIDDRPQELVLDKEKIVGSGQANLPEKSGPKA